MRNTITSSASGPGGGAHERNHITDADPDEWSRRLRAGRFGRSGVRPELQDSHAGLWDTLRVSGPSENRWHRILERLADPEPLTRPSCVLCCAANGKRNNRVGKTYPASLACLRAADAGMDAKIIHAIDLFDRMAWWASAVGNRLSLQDRVAEYLYWPDRHSAFDRCGYQLLLIDECDKAQVSDYEWSLFGYIINRRVENRSGGRGGG